MANKVPVVVADFETQLSSAIAAGATSFTLASGTDDDGVAIPAGKYCFTINNGSSNKQYLIGQLNGTSVTSVMSVSRQGAETSGASYPARAGSPVIISDFATLQRVADVLRGILTLDGSSPLEYDAEPTLSARTDIATVGYVLDNVTGGTVDFDSQVITPATGGETIVAGDLVYFNTADQEWYKCDADTSATVTGVQIAIALGSGSNGVAITNGVQISGVYTTTGLTAGATYYASNTAGGISTSAGTNSRVIGVALSTTKLLVLNITPITLPTPTVSALSGTPSTPSSTNKFVTQAKSVTAGATINGATTPVPVYQNTTDNEFYACDANDTSALRFAGFAISNGTDGNTMLLQSSGIVSGFTGLDEGLKYYVQDAVGTIGTTPGTYNILVGTAISTTELLIQKGRVFASGHLNLTATGVTVVTTGFRPDIVKIVATETLSGSGTTVAAQSFGSYSGNGSNKCVGVAKTAAGTITTFNDTTYSYYVGNQIDTPRYARGTVTTITNTGFSIDHTETASGPDVYLYWEAEGYL